MKKYFALFLCAFLAMSLSEKTNARAYTVDEVVYDHVGPTYRTDTYFQAPWGQHQGALHGVPSYYDWADGARPGDWMTMGSNQSIASWGQVYEWASESSETNIRVQVRNFKLYGLVSGTWQLLEQGTDSSTIDGANFAEDFSSAGSYSNVRGEASGGISFTMVSDYNFHFWISTWPRVIIPSGTTAFYTSCEMRLIPDTDPNVDLSQAKYLAGISNDYYPTSTSSGAGPWPSLSITRHKFITSQWQTYSSYIGGSIPTSVAQYRSTITGNPLPPGVIDPYTEDFSDNLAQNWTLSANVSVASHMMSTASWVANTSAIYNGATYSSPYTYKIDKYANGGAPGNVHQVLFNYTNSNNYYFVEFTDGASGTATLKKKVGGTVSTLASYGVYPTNGTWVTVEVTYEANTITVKATKSGVQTTLFNGVSDSSLTSGQIGVSTSYDNVDFDNVTVN